MEHICQEIRKIFCLSDNIIIVPYEEAIGTVTWFLLNIKA